MRSNFEYVGVVSLRRRLLSLHVCVVLILFLGGVLSAANFSKVEFAGKNYTVCYVDVAKEKLQLFLRDERGQTFKTFAKLAPWLEAHGQKLVFAMNAGMYHSDFSPVGLFVTDGKEVAPLNLANAEGNFFLKPNGVFMISGETARIIESSEYPRNQTGVTLATQSGPLLLHRGKVHPAFKEGSDSRLFRNGVGVSGSGMAVFVISEEPVNLYEFAVLFRDKLKCANALFFDGTISSLYSPELNRRDFRMDLGPIIGLTQ